MNNNSTCSSSSSRRWWWWWAVTLLLRILLCCLSVYYVRLSHWFVTFGFERRERIDFSFTLQTSFPLCGEMGSSFFLFRWSFVMTDMSFRIILV
ncbi:hypothetical protein NC651_008114 [Populus alba x Populus x berolinensis]|nr:hypothetical protein NC651_008114 [Populus alba x Populus x berolinensis]